MSLKVKALVLTVFATMALSLTAQPGTLHHPGSLVMPLNVTQPSAEKISKNQETQTKALSPAKNIIKPAPGDYPSMYDNNIVVAYYGHPKSNRMGILGEGSLADQTAKLKELCAEYDALNGPDEGVIPAYHLIYATIHPDAGVGVLSDNQVLEYVQYGLKNGVIVVLDHQLGKHSVEESVRRMLPFLIYPNVHIAIDPEWKTLTPGKVIGGIDASDVNKALDMIQEYLVANNIKQRKMLMVHQFVPKMIANSQNVKLKHSRVDLIHNADGFGGAQLKLNTYRMVASAKNMPLKGFKLFLAKTWKTEGFDKPVLTPKQVLELDPRPVFLNYQ